MTVARKPARKSSRRVLPKADRPETLGQAKVWDRANRRYIKAGLCYVCAAQAAWGHQIGFSRVHPPCEACASIVARFPIVAVAPWHKLVRTSKNGGWREPTASDPAQVPGDDAGYIDGYDAPAGNAMLGALVDDR